MRWGLLGLLGGEGQLRGGRLAVGAVLIPSPVVHSGGSDCSNRPSGSQTHCTGAVVALLLLEPS